MPRPLNLSPVCVDCGLDTDDLSKYKKTLRGYRNLCTKCASARQIETIRAGGKRHHNTKKSLVDTAKSKPCTDCNIEYPPYVMQFDHLPDYVKSFNVSAYARYSLEQVKSEILKCEVVCANCHAIRSFKRLNKGL